MAERGGTSRSSGSSAPKRRTPANKTGTEGGEYRSGDVVKTGFVFGNTFRAKAVQYTVIDGLAMFEGDIVLGTEEEMASRSAAAKAELSRQVAAGVIISGNQFRWTGCRIPYTIDAALPNQARVTDAIAHWEANTQFRFTPRGSEADYVTFRPAGGCSSSVGKQGGQQFVNLGPGCTTGNTIHEIGHVVGLWHEQSREDRDAFVTINWAKIQAGMEHNFNQHIADGDDVGAYDYGSIMHYPRTAFSVDGSDTITPVDAAAQIGQRTALSAGDIAAANSMCPVVGTLKEVPKDGLFDTRKELTKDIRLDTRKEQLADTRKEMIKDRVKEVAKDAIKDASFDGIGKAAADRINPGGIGQIVNPAIRGAIARVRQPGEALPFAVATPHQAPAAAQEGELLDATGQLDAQLEVLANAIAESEANVTLLQQQYNETAALLQGTLDALDPPGG